jgi:hypothetical protein
VSARGEEKGQRRTLFDVDRLRKLVTLAPLLASNSFPRPARLGASARPIKRTRIRRSAYGPAMTGEGAQSPAGWSVRSLSTYAGGAPT